jgi:pimeloyl-ACP methyl ester carboxylesterase
MFAEYNGLKIHYEIQGHGENLVMLHGWGCSGETFAPVVEKLKENFRVTYIDFSGFGQSDTPDSEWKVDNYMESLLTVFADAGIDKAHIIAHSFGGRVVIKLASIYPHLVNKIIITGGAGVKPKRGFKYYIKVYRFKMFKKMAKVKWITAFLNFLGFDVKKYIANAGSADYRKLPDSMKKTFSNVVNEDLTNYLPSIASPTLLVWGEEDTETPLWMAKVMEKLIPDSGLVTYSGAGHYAFLQRVNEFNKVCEYFLKETKK